MIPSSESPSTAISWEVSPTLTPVLTETTGGVPALVLALGAEIALLEVTGVALMRSPRIPFVRSVAGATPPAFAADVARGFRNHLGRDRSLSPSSSPQFFEEPDHAFHRVNVLTQRWFDQGGCSLS